MRVPRPSLLGWVRATEPKLRRNYPIPSRLPAVHSGSNHNRDFAADRSACYPPRMPPAEQLRNPDTPRHTALVRVTHWITVVAFLALLVTGVEILISHPRFYWGETGNSGTQPLFRLHIPSSRPTVPSGYSYLLPDENGWSRYLHFEAGCPTSRL
jgi:Prokaryotic cytochrome b561